MGKTPLFTGLQRVLQTALSTESSSTTPFFRKTVSRRTVLKQLLHASTALAAYSSLHAMGVSSRAWAGEKHDTAPPNETPTAPPEEKTQIIPQDVVIVGGGVAGLSLAYRLAKAKWPCAVYEASGRFGGRMKTLSNFNEAGMFCELGGELIDTGHDDIKALCEELGLPLQKLLLSREEACDSPNSENNLYYFNGKTLDDNDILAAFEPVAAQLAKDIARAFPDGAVEIPTYQNPYGLKWLDHKNLKDYLTDIAMQDWLRQLLTVAYEGEYGLPAEEQSALNLLLLINPTTDDGFQVFGASDEAYRIQGGNESLPKALKTYLSEHIPLYQQHVLTGLQYHSEEKYFTLFFQNKHQRKTVLARYVVLALPWSILRQLNGIDSLPLSPIKAQAIAELGYGTNSKLMLGFKTRFWQSETRPQLDGLFTDLPAMSYWETSRGQNGTAGLLTNFLGAQAGKWASSSSRKQALDDLGQIFSLDAHSQYDGHQALANWSQHPWTQGSYSCPKPGQYTRFMGCQQEAECDNQLFFVGEHCSLNHMGFMNGAVESANNAFLALSEKLTAERASDMSGTKNPAATVLN